VNLDQQIADFEARLEANAKDLDNNFPWAMFLIGELDQTGKTTNEILAVKDQRERYYLALGRLGALIGGTSDEDQFAIKFSSAVLATVEDLQ